MVCRGVYHGQEASAEAADPKGLAPEGISMTRGMRTRTQIDPGTGKYKLPPVSPLFCTTPDGTRLPLHTCDVVRPGPCQGLLTREGIVPLLNTGWRHFGKPAEEQVVAVSMLQLLNNSLIGPTQRSYSATKALLASVCRCSCLTSPCARSSPIWTGAALAFPLPMPLLQLLSWQHAACAHRGV